MNKAFITKFIITSNINNIILIDLVFKLSVAQNVFAITCFSLKLSQKYKQNVLLSFTIASSNSKSSKEVSKYYLKNSSFLLSVWR